MSNTPRKPHFFPDVTSKTHDYKPSGGGGGPRSMPSRVRQDHASELLTQYKSVQDDLKNVREKREKYEVSTSGQVITFELTTSKELDVKSLERQASKIELLSYKDNGAGKAVATVFLPENKNAYYSNLFESYRDENTRHGKPKGEQLVSHIDTMRKPTLMDLWTDPVEPAPPTSDENHWWEIWVRASMPPEIFKEHAVQLDITLSARVLTLVDRWVFLAHTTPSKLGMAVELLLSIAEVRKAHSLSHFFNALPGREARGFINNLNERLGEPPGPEAPYVCLLDTGVYAKHPLLTDALSLMDVDVLEPGWSVDDYAPYHGTQMCGFALYGDELEDLLQDHTPYQHTHKLASVKILSQTGNDPELYGDITDAAVSIAEIARAEARQIYTLAITAGPVPQGVPTSWSAAVDQICSGYGQSEPRSYRCMIVSAGNVECEAVGYSYPDSNHVTSIQDPAQAWNAITVGAYTERSLMDPEEEFFESWLPLASVGDLSPASSTSLTWDVTSSWPNKPDIVLEGGNAASDQLGNQTAIPDSLSLITTGNPTNLLSVSGDTSAATNIAGCYAARIWALYPHIYPETIRGLLIHSARWTKPMRDAMERYQPDAPRRRRITNLLRCYGYGVPNLSAALEAFGNSATLIIEDDLQPYKKDSKTKNVTMNEMKTYELPWPEDALMTLADAEVRLRVTLSYFVEPNPSERGRTNRYRYASHGLRFAFKTASETESQFLGRINKAQKEDGESSSTSDTDNWEHGKECLRGSIHSDVWKGSAASLSSKGILAIYPVGGWWKDYTGKKQHGRKVRFSLIVSIETDETSVDLYHEVANLIEVANTVDVEIQN